LIQNRAFQYSDLYNVSTAHYFPVNGAKLDIKFLEQPLSKALPASMRVSASNATTGTIGFQNDGYWGMDVRKQKYTGSFWVKGAYKGVFTASLESNLTRFNGSREVYGSVDVQSKAVTGEWVEHAFELTPEKDAESSNNTFSITFDPRNTETGHLDFNLISLFPPTYKGRKNGLRIDIAEALADMNPVSVISVGMRRR
jgi:alpha-N-arabinofuranosidase